MDEVEDCNFGKLVKIVLPNILNSLKKLQFISFVKIKLPYPSCRYNQPKKVSLPKVDTEIESYFFSATRFGGH